MMRDDCKTVCPICQSQTTSPAEKLKVCDACIAKLKAEGGTGPKFADREELSVRRRA
jgi:hypothetical protein